MILKRESQKKSQLSDAHRDYEKCLIAHALFKISNKATSEDLVQATFIKTWSYIAKGGAIKEMRAFLYHVLDQLIIDEYRKRKMISLDALIERGLEIKIDKQAGAYDISEEKMAIASIGDLPEKYKKVVHMHYAQDMSIKNISKMTGQSENCISVQLHRGYEKLKLLIKEKNKIISG